jgi:GNAT superfamily N-acetyltransferase
MNLLRTERTNAKNNDFKTLVSLLDKELKIRDGEDHEFYHQFNHIDTIHHVIVIYSNKKPIACGALKEYDSHTMEVKRMFTLKSQRGKGAATKILNELEIWAKELGYQKCILETGFNQPEAINLYKKNNYNIVENYGQYKNVDTSICFEKVLT